MTFKFKRAQIEVLPIDYVEPTTTQLSTEIKETVTTQITKVEKPVTVSNQVEVQVDETAEQIITITLSQLQEMVNSAVNAAVTEATVTLKEEIKNLKQKIEINQEQTKEVSYDVNRLLTGAADREYKSQYSNPDILNSLKAELKSEMAIKLLEHTEKMNLYIDSVSVTREKALKDANKSLIDLITILARTHQNINVVKKVHRQLRESLGIEIEKTEPQKVYKNDKKILEGRFG